jgi:hypothetical protein
LTESVIVPFSDNIYTHSKTRNLESGKQAVEHNVANECLNIDGVTGVPKDSPQLGKAT